MSIEVEDELIELRESQPDMFESEELIEQVKYNIIFSITNTLIILIILIIILLHFK